jgi:hypothetical protein
MAALYSSGASVDFFRTTLSYMSEDRTLHNHCRENLKSYTELKEIIHKKWVTQNIVWGCLRPCWIEYLDGREKNRRMEKLNNLHPFYIKTYCGDKIKEENME